VTVVSWNKWGSGLDTPACCLSKQLPVVWPQVDHRLRFRMGTPVSPLSHPQGFWPQAFPKAQTSFSLS
jgi:hypothetical protein